MTTDDFPAAPGQERMWFLATLEPDLAVYNVNLWLPLDPAWSPALVRRALAAVVERHEALRTTFRLDGAAVTQVVHREVPVAIAETSIVDDPDTAGTFDRIARADAAEPFPLDRAPLWRARMVRAADDDVRLIWICDHTVFDGASSDPFVTDFLATARALAADRVPDLVELPVQFADYAVWLRERLTDGYVAAELAHWRAALAGLPEDIGLPTDRPRPPTRSYRGSVHRFALPADLTARVDTWSRRHGVTPFMTLLAVFKTLLSRWTGHDDMFVGCPMAGRPVPELQRLVGMFVNAVVVRTDLAGDPPFTEAVTRVRASLLDAIEHQELPFERVVDDLRRVRDLSRPPLYQVAFNLVPSDTRGQIANGTVKVDLALDLNVRDGRLHGRLEYATDLFDTATVERLAGTFATLLAAALDAPDLPLSRIPLMTRDERAAVLALGHGPTVELAGPSTLTDLLRAQAARTPSAVAVVAGPDSMTFAELAERSERLARCLRTRGVGPETPVVVCLERGLPLVVALVAVLKAGGVIAPMDPDLPDERAAFQIEDSGAVAVIGRFPDAIVEGPDGPAFESAVAPDDAAYLLYTSGSTGRPKGVLTTHRALAHRLDWMRRLRLDDTDVVLHKTSAGFDVSLWELFLPLVTGMRLVLAEPGGQRDPAYLRDEIVRSGVTTVHFVPSMMDVFLATDGIEACRSLRRIVCSGEELTESVARRCAERLPWVELYNLYGPTEAAIDVSLWRYDPAQRGPVPIGHPVDNTRLHVLDRRLEPVPVGFPGELHIGGVQLARGYLNRPELASFVAGPDGERLYRTGDLARVRPDGALLYLGRLDTQVKIHGVRVELGEIEGVLARHPDVRHAVAAVRDDAPGGRGLVAYVDWTGDADRAVTELRDLLGRHLPQTLLPQAFVLTDVFPTLPSGKVDRSALPAPQTADLLPTAYVPPATPVEAQLCALWSELLGREKVGTADDFFELGGHSLLAAHLVGRVRERYGVDLPLRRCFEVPTVAGQALEILALKMSTLTDDELAALLA